MKTFYDFGKKMYGGVWEIESDMPYGRISEVPFDKENIKQLDLPFRICHGKKQRDIIYLSQYGDIKPYLYPIHINDVDDVYYFIHNLPEVKFINRNAYISGADYKTEIPCFLLPENLPPLFTLNESRYKIVTPEMKTAMIKAKLTNIAFQPVYGVSSMAEYYELRCEGKLRQI